ncbi:MAG: lipid A phosphoethanolamine transferase [Muribaculaceae bacterium]|nr:lipid A phosphoethanolamine transferase [Muribaculaceae bacterium]
MKLFEKIKDWLGGVKCSRKLLFILCVVSLSLPNLFLFFTEQASLIVRLCNVVLPVSVYWLAMTLSRKPGKAYLWMFVLVFFAAFQIVLLYLFGNSVIAVDMFLNLVTTNPTEVGELLSNILLAVAFVVVVYLPLLFLSICTLFQEPLPDEFRIRQRRYAKYGCGAGLVLLIGSYVLDKNFELENDIYPANVLYNVGLAVEREIKLSKYFDTSQDFAFNAETVRDAAQKEVYVLVIGETARANNFGIYGYNRNTTPLLGSMNDLVVFKEAMTQSNTTHKSVPMIMSAVSAYNFDDIYRQKSIITAFNEVGYSTAFFSNQRRNHSFIDFFGEEAYVYKFVKEDLPGNGNVSDDALLDLVKEFMASTDNKKNFIVLHTYGSHFEYSERYPADKAYFKPDRTISAVAENRETLINAYDNSIRATDEFLYKLIKEIEAQGAASAVMYVSDHGEDIYDDERKLFLHASPIPSHYQLHVPFMIWTSEEYDKLFPQKRKNLLHNTEEEVATNLAVFHTLLDLAGITTFYKKDYYALSSEDFEPCDEPIYLNDHNRPVPVADIMSK